MGSKMTCTRYGCSGAATKELKLPCGVVWERLCEECHQELSTEAEGEEECEESQIC